MAPKISKPELVKKLKKLWDNYYATNTYLKSIEIKEDSERLRGIRNSKLDFQFPITVLTGKNGTGKTTFLSLSVLGFHASKPPYYQSFSNEYYDFSFFFPTTLKDRHPAGIKIDYEFFNSSLQVLKGKDRWMRYIKNNKEPRRPKKGTEFIGISRIVPAFEKKNYKNYFASKDRFQEAKHQDKLTPFMERIVQKKYGSLSELKHTDSSGAHVLHGYNGLHTSFNAGAGEECLMAILSTLLNCEDNSIIAIEEIEIGLHPSAILNMIDVIMEIALDKKLQIIITSHSPEFLRSCPSESLIFLQRNGEKIEFIHQPNIEYAIKAIGGHHQMAINILCEDVAAKAIINTVLPYKLQSLSSVIAYGGKSELIKKAKIVQEINQQAKIVIIWDGEVESTLLQEATNEGFIGLKLPSSFEPEQYMLQKLNTENGINFLINKYEFTEGGSRRVYK